MKFSFIILLIALSSILFTGLDLTHHAHNSWLYYDMIKSMNISLYNPYLNGQINYAYGIPAYFIAGLLWFLFSINSISIMQAVMLIVSYILLVKWIKDEKWVSGLMLANIFFTIFDAYPSHFSNCLFWIASYAYYNRKKWWSIPLIISAFNHPYTLLASLFFAFKKKWLFLPLGAILSYFIIATKAFSDNTYFPVYTLFMGLVRIFFNLLPVMVLKNIGVIKEAESKLVKKFLSIKLSLVSFLTTLFILGTVAILLAMYTLTMQPEQTTDFKLFENMPVLNGTLRVIDYLYLPSVYALPVMGYKLDAGSFRENNPQHMIKLYFESSQEYYDFISKKSVDFVLFCKRCNPQSNEGEILMKHYPLIWENDYYYLYSLN